MRMRIRDKLRKNSADDKIFYTFRWFTLKGKSNKNLDPFFDMYGQAYAWIRTASGLRIFQNFWKSGLGLPIYVKNEVKSR